MDFRLDCIQAARPGFPVQPDALGLGMTDGRPDETAYGEFVERLSTRFAIIHKGAITTQGTLDEVRAGLGSLEEVFLAVTGDGGPPAAEAAAEDEAAP